MEYYLTLNNLYRYSTVVRSRIKFRESGVHLPVNADLLLEQLSIEKLYFSLKPLIESVYRPGQCDAVYFVIGKYKVFYENGVPTLLEWDLESKQIEWYPSNIVQRKNFTAGYFMSVWRLRGIGDRLVSFIDTGEVLYHWASSICGSSIDGDEFQYRFNSEDISRWKTENYFPANCITANQHDYDPSNKISEVWKSRHGFPTDVLCPQ